MTRGSGRVWEGAGLAVDPQRTCTGNPVSCGDSGVPNGTACRTGPPVAQQSQATWKTLTAENMNIKAGGPSYPGERADSAVGGPPAAVSRSEFMPALGLPHSRSGQGPASGDLLEVAYMELGIHHPRHSVLMCLGSGSLGHAWFPMRVGSSTSHVFHTLHQRRSPGAAPGVAR